MTLEEIKCSIALGVPNIDEIKAMSVDINTDIDTLRYFIENNNFDFKIKLNSIQTLREKLYDNNRFMN